MSKLTDVTWSCRFHPTDWWHEVGCPHVEWTVEQLRDALVEKKRFEQGKIESVIAQQVAHDAEVAARAKREQMEAVLVGLEYEIRKCPPSAVNGMRRAIDLIRAAWAKEHPENTDAS